MNTEDGPDRQAHSPVTTAKWFDSEIKFYVKNNLTPDAWPRNESKDLVADVLVLARDLAMHRPHEWCTESQLNKWHSITTEADRKLATTSMGIPKMQEYIDEAILRKSVDGLFHDSLNRLEVEILQNKLFQDEVDKVKKKKGEKVVESMLKELDMEPPGKEFHSEDVQQVLNAAKQRMEQSAEQLHSKSKTRSKIVAILEESYSDISENFKKMIVELATDDRYSGSNFNTERMLIDRELERVRLVEESDTLHLLEEDIRNEFLYMLVYFDIDYTKKRLKNRPKYPIPEYAHDDVARKVDIKLERTYLKRDQLRLGPFGFMPDGEWHHDPENHVPPPEAKKYVNKTIDTCSADWLDSRENEGWDSPTPSEELEAIPNPAVANPGDQHQPDALYIAAESTESVFATISIELMKAPFGLADALQTIQREAQLHHRTEDLIEAILELAAISLELQRRQLGEGGPGNAALLAVLTDASSTVRSAMVSWVHGAMRERDPTWWERYPNGVPSSESSAAGAYDSQENADYRRIVRYAYGNESAGANRTSESENPLVKAVRSEGVLGLLQGVFSTIREQLRRLDGGRTDGLAGLVAASLDEREALGAEGAEGG